MDVLEEAFEAQAKTLREFGYPSVTAEMVKDAHGRWEGGEDAEGIVEMMCFGAFDRYRKIFTR